jgi:hypothetical protein
VIVEEAQFAVAVKPLELSEEAPTHEALRDPWQWVRARTSDQ